MNNYFLSEKNEINNKVNLVLYFTFLAYIISLFLKDAPVVSNILMALIFLFSLLNRSSTNYSKRLIINPVNIGIVVFFLFQIVSVFFSENMQSGFSTLMLRLPLLILPLSFCFIDFDKKVWDKILLFYAFSTTIASLIGFLFGVYKTVIEYDTGNLYNDNISEVIGKQAVYFSLYVGVAIMVFVIQLKEYPSNVQKYRWLIYWGISWLLFILFMLASRIAMFGVLMILSFYLLTILIKKRKYFEIVLFLFFLIIGIVIMSKVFPKTLNRFNGTTEINFQYNNQNVETHFNEEFDKSKWNGTTTRAAIWTCAIEIWKLQPIVGTGLGDRNHELMKKYREKQFWYGLGTNKNTHNQYLDILLSMGVLGLIVFALTFFIYPIKLFLEQKQIFSIAVYTLLAVCFITENMLDRYQGVIFISFILPLVAKIINDRDVKGNKN